MKNYLNYNNNYIYKLVSNKLFYSKILNIKKYLTITIIQLKI